MAQEGLYFYEDFDDSITITTIAGCATPTPEEVRDRYEKGQLKLGTHYWVGDTDRPSGNIREGETVRYLIVPEPSDE